MPRDRVSGCAPWQGAVRYTEGGFRRAEGRLVPSTIYVSPDVVLAGCSVDRDDGRSGRIWAKKATEVATTNKAPSHLSLCTLRRN
jgi:hypothetical protein